MLCGVACQMTLLCCPTGVMSVMSVIANITTEKCAAIAWPTVSHSGLLADGSCGGCASSEPLVPCDDGLQAGTIRTFVDRQGCTGNWCLACAGTAISDPPPHARVFVSGSCAYVTAGDNVPFNLSGTLANANVLVPPGGATLLNGPLRARGNFGLAGGPLTVLTPLGYDQCAVELTNVGASYVLAINATILSANDSECGIQLAPSAGNVYPTVSGSVGPVVHLTGKQPYYSLAVANTAGRIAVDPACSLIVVDSDPDVRLTTSPSCATTMNLSALMAVFGTDYEIEFNHAGVLDAKPTYFQAHAGAWNQYLLILLVTLVVNHFSHGSNNAQNS
jgi:hypothetical protein